MGKMLFRVINNSAAVMIGQLCYRLISFLTGILIVRSLSSDLYGQYSFIFVYLSFFEVFIQFGFNSILTRWVAQDPALAPRILGNALLFRVGLCLLMLPLAWAAIGWMGYPAGVQEGVFVAGLGLFMTLRTIFEVVYRVRMKMAKAFFWLCVKALLQLALVAAVSRLQQPSLMLFILIALASGYAALLAFWWAGRHEIQMDFTLDTVILRRLLREAFPLLLSGYLTMIYYRVDVFMLSKMCSFAEVGYYSVAVRIAESLDFFSTAVLVSVFPILARSFKENRAEFESTVKHAWRVQLLAVLPMVVGGWMVSRDLILFLFGAEYAAASTTLILLLIYTLFCYVGGLLANVLIACGRQGMDACFSFILVLMNIVLNSLLIPRLGYNGAAASTAMVEFSGVVLLTIYCVRNKDIRLPIPWKDIGRIVLANGVFAAALALILTITDWHILGTIAAGAVLYAAVLFIFGFVPVAKIQTYLAHFRAKPEKPHEL